MLHRSNVIWFNISTDFQFLWSSDGVEMTVPLEGIGVVMVLIIMVVGLKAMRVEVLLVAAGVKVGIGVANGGAVGRLTAVEMVMILQVVEVMISSKKASLVDVAAMEVVKLQEEIGVEVALARIQVGEEGQVNGVAILSVAVAVALVTEGVITNAVEMILDTAPPTGA
ncbi:hypothetical protein JCGZ_24588 [Jatropha curcas]|uniref:Uncharacterized protein n=1 Tax=Jatropha curcas TaxID=180498 RepID=A0A067L909_JATCU|nr:hypothetical protein JCGZ_24588 [Jatropha curcas]